MVVHFASITVIMGLDASEVGGIIGTVLFLIF